MRKLNLIDSPGIDLAVCYYPEHWPRTMWQEDLQRMKRLGIRTVRVAEFAWQIFEPEEGVYDFSFFDAFLELAREEEMQVIFSTPTAIPPVWMSEAYPEILNSRKDGVLYRHGMRRHYNYNSPLLRKKAAAIVRELARHYAPHPAVIGWQIDNEFNCELDEFYSESDTLAFRDFLQEKYKSLDALNKAWGTVFWNQTYTDWEEVYVPRTAIKDTTNPHQLLDYKRFISASVVSYCKLQSDILKEYLKEGDFITTNGMFKSIDYHELNAECLDFLSYDLYPNFAFALGEEPLKPGALNDRHWSKNLTEVRAVSPAFGIMEMQSGANGWSKDYLAPAPKPGQISLWAFAAVLHGACFISFFRWRTALFGTEMYWHGILDYDNADNRKCEEIKDFAQKIQHLEAVKDSAYKAAFALIKDYDNDYDQDADDWHRTIARSSEEAIFAASASEHVPMDIVRIDHTEDARELEAYPLLIYPHPVIADPKTADLLADYVKKGGSLLIGARSGQKDKNGHCVMQKMPAVFRELSQSEVEEFTFVGPADKSVKMSFAGETTDSGCFNEVLRPLSERSEITGRYLDNYYKGEPAAIVTPFGKGRVMHFGGSFTRDNTKAFFRYFGAEKFFSEWLEAGAALELGMRENEEGIYIFALNYSAGEETIVLHKKCRELLSGKEAAGEFVLPPYGTAVFAFERTKAC